MTLKDYHNSSTRELWRHMNYCCTKAQMTGSSFLNLQRELTQSRNCLDPHFFFFLFFTCSSPQDGSVWLVFSKARIQAALATVPRPPPDLQHLSGYPFTAPSRGQPHQSFSAGCGQICTCEKHRGAIEKGSHQFRL